MMDHILGHKTVFRKFKKLELLSSIFSNQNSMNLQISNRKNVSRKKKKEWSAIENAAER